VMSNYMRKDVYGFGIEVEGVGNYGQGMDGEWIRTGWVWKGCLWMGQVISNGWS
jgi:hypothetical protein